MLVSRPTWRLTDAPPEAQKRIQADVAQSFLVIDEEPMLHLDMACLFCVVDARGVERSRTKPLTPQDGYAQGAVCSVETFPKQRCIVRLNIMKY